MTNRTIHELNKELQDFIFLINKFQFENNVEDTGIISMLALTIQIKAVKIKNNQK